MIRLILSAMLLSVLAACSLPGPTPTDKNFTAATAGLKDIDKAEIIVEGAWAPNVRLGSMVSFSSEMTPGRLLLTPDVFYFVIYDEGSARFLPAYEMAYANMEWVTSDTHGVARILRFQAENAIHSFLFQNGVKLTGEDIGKDDVIAYVAERVNKP